MGFKGPFGFCQLLTFSHEVQHENTIFHQRFILVILDRSFHFSLWFEVDGNALRLNESNLEFDHDCQMSKWFILND